MPLAALLMSLSDPNRSIQQEVSAAISLLHLGVSDPKVDESLVRYADSSEAARGALREMGPKAARFVPDLIGKLRVALQSSQQVDAHFGIVSLLEAIGPAGETALVELMRSLTVSGQTRLAMAWVEAKPAARPEILRAMKVDEVGDLLAKELASHEQDTLGISEGPAFLGVPDGVSLRAAAGILLLGLEPREQAWKVMLGALSTENPLSLRLDYATFMVGEIDPTMARPAIPALVKLLGRVSGDDQLRLIRAIGRIGDQTAVAPLESMARDGDSELTREAAKRALAAIQSRL